MSWYDLCFLASAAPSETAASVFSVPGTWMLAVALVALVAALAVTGSMKAKLKTAAQKAAASDYVRADSLELKVNTDRFLYVTEERKRIESQGEQAHQEKA